jgi:predicted lysophospholipase L1 biosynthesis ABC-type transport system permease subunit
VSVGPLRRATATVGLVALIPIASLLVLGAVTPEAAAIRASAVVLAVVVVGNVARAVLTRVLRRVERRAAPSVDPDEQELRVTGIGHGR